MSDVYIYNPTGEMAIANGNHSYMPPKLLRTFEDDLQFLPTFFAKDHDIIIGQDPSDKDFLNQWQQLGLASATYKPASQINQPIHYLRPWSWNPASHHKLNQLKDLCSEEFKQSPNYQWTIDHKNFFSRATANRVQQYIQETYSHPLVCIQESAISITDISEIENWFNKHNNAVIKLPWSSSGRGVHIVDTKNNKPLNKEWVIGGLKQQGFITIEPLLQKVKDFSFQLYIHTSGKIDFLGTSNFTNDDKGHFTGGLIHYPHQKDEVSEFFSDSLLQDAANILIEAVQSTNPHHYYEGYIGVDGIVYKNQKNQLQLHPCLDINWRYNMGNINIILPNYVHISSKGHWMVKGFKPTEWVNFIKQQQKQHPLQIKNNQIHAGFITLTPPNIKSIFGAWMHIY